MDMYLASIMGWGPAWSPRNWTLCAGQLLGISQFTAVFSLVGTIYGGDGRTTFRMPDLRARVPVAAGQSPGTQFIPQGALIGSDTNTLTVLEMPVHNHTANLQNLVIQVATSSSDGTEDDPSGHIPAASNVGSGLSKQTVQTYAPVASADGSLAGTAIGGSVIVGNTGGSQPFSIVQPLQAIQFIFCLQGIFPPRN